MNYWTIAGLGSLFFLSTVLTQRVKRYALCNSMLDVPNDRSSHTIPTPRGGGLGFSIILLALLPAFVLTSPEQSQLWIALFGGGMLTATVGWIDDRQSLSARTRFVVHLLAGIWTVSWLGGLPVLQLGQWQLPLGLFGGALAVVGVVWSTNLYNFMDGIDGLAGSQAVIVGLIGGTLFALSGEMAPAVVCWAIAATAGGFLAWNWPPAKIFMGDCGSGLLGFLIAGLALYGENSGSVPLLVWTVLMGVFLCDATATLLARMMAGEKWYKAHCTHAFQRLVKAGLTHRQVTSGIIGVNVLLAVLAATIWKIPAYAVPGLLTTYTVLGVLWKVSRSATPAAVAPTIKLHKPETDQPAETAAPAQPVPLRRAA